MTWKGVLQLDNALSERQDLARELSASQARASELLQQLKVAQQANKKVRGRVEELEKRSSELDAALEERYHLQVRLMNPPSWRTSHC